MSPRDGSPISKQPLPGFWRIGAETDFGPQRHELLAVDLDGDATIDHLLYAGIHRPYVGPQNDEWIGRDLTKSSFRWSPLHDEDLVALRARLEEAEHGSIRNAPERETLLEAFGLGGLDGAAFVGMLALFPAAVPVVSALMVPSIVDEGRAIARSERDGHAIAHFVGMFAGASAAGAIAPRGHIARTAFDRTITRTGDVSTRAMRAAQKEMAAYTARKLKNSPAAGPAAARTGFISVDFLLHPIDWLARRNPFGNPAKRARLWRRHARRVRSARLKARAYRRAAHLFDRAGLRAQAAQSFLDAGQHALNTGSQWKRAAQAYEAAAGIFTLMNQSDSLAIAAQRAAEAWRRAGDIKKAAKLEETCALFSAERIPDSRDAFMRHAAIRAELEDAPGANRSWLAAAKRSSELADQHGRNGRTMAQADALADAARAFLRGGEEGEAGHFLEQAGKRYQEINTFDGYVKAADALALRANLLSTKELWYRDAASDLQKGSELYGQAALEMKASGKPLRAAHYHAKEARNSFRAAQLHQTSLHNTLRDYARPATKKHSAVRSELPEVRTSGLAESTQSLKAAIEMNISRANSAIENVIELLQTSRAERIDAKLIEAHQLSVEIMHFLEQSGASIDNSIALNARHLLLAQLFERNGRIEEATTAYEAIRPTKKPGEADPEFVQSRTESARQRGQLAAATKRAQPLISADHLFRRGEAYRAIGEQRLARQSFGQAAKRFEKHSDFQRAIDAYRQEWLLLRQTGESRRNARAAIRVGTRIAKLAERRGDLESADSMRVWVTRALYARGKRFRAARQLKGLERSLRTRLEQVRRDQLPAEERALRQRLAMLLHQRGRFLDAAREYVESADVYATPEVAQQLRQAGELFAQKRRWNDAREHLERAANMQRALGNSAAELDVLLRLRELLPNKRRLRKARRETLERTAQLAEQMARRDDGTEEIALSRAEQHRRRSRQHIEAAANRYQLAGELRLELGQYEGAATRGFIRAAALYRMLEKTTEQRIEQLMSDSNAKPEQIERMRETERERVRRFEKAAEFCEAQTDAALRRHPDSRSRKKARERRNTMMSEIFPQYAFLERAVSSSSPKRETAILGEGQHAPNTIELKLDSGKSVIIELEPPKSDSSFQVLSDAQLEELLESAREVPSGHYRAITSERAATEPNGKPPEESGD